MRWVLGSFIILLIVAFGVHERWLTPQTELMEAMRIYSDARLAQLQFQKRFGRFASGPELIRSGSGRLPNPCDGKYCLTVTPSVNGYKISVVPDQTAAEDRRRRLLLSGDESGWICFKYGGIADAKAPVFQHR